MKYVKYGHCKWQIIKPEDCEIPTLSVTIYKKAWSDKGDKPVKKGDHITITFPDGSVQAVGEVTDVDDNSFTVK